jgi:hypothetical protein
MKIMKKPMLVVGKKPYEKSRFEYLTQHFSVFVPCVEWMFGSAIGREQHRPS